MYAHWERLSGASRDCNSSHSLRLVTGYSARHQAAFSGRQSAFQPSQPNPIWAQNAKENSRFCSTWNKRNEGEMRRFGCARTMRGGSGALSQDDNAGSMSGKLERYKRLD